MNNRTFKAKRTLAFLALASASLCAGAVTISVDSNNPHQFVWLFSSAAGDLTGSGQLTLSGFNSNVLTVGVTLNNTSATSSHRLTSFGFGIDPNATGVTFSDVADAGMVNASMAHIPTLATIEVCAFGGPNCSGGGNGGLHGGASDSFSLLLSGNWGSSVNIDPIGFKYQTGAGSFEFTSSSATTSSTSGGVLASGTVPEPGTGTLALLGLALLGAGFGMRRTRAGQA
ncbi:MAG TPA: cistern family PEP-CTERM protein [Burkholderiaceae bacterium]|nr:cistern family PEP-CTERM protein [Burkholderiaceae bacterium]